MTGIKQQWGLAGGNGTGKSTFLKTCIFIFALAMITATLKFDHA